MWGSAAHLFAQNFDVHLAGIVICTDGPYFEPGDPKIDEIDKLHKIHVLNIQGCVFVQQKRVPAAITQTTGWWLAGSI